MKALNISFAGKCLKLLYMLDKGLLAGNMALLLPPGIAGADALCLLRDVPGRWAALWALDFGPETCRS